MHRFVAGLLVFTLAAPACAQSLAEARKELANWRLTEAAQVAHKAQGLPARFVEIEALTESNRLGEAWRELRGLPREAFRESQFYVLRGQLSALKGDCDSTRKDFVEALQRARPQARFDVLCQASVAFSRCKQPQEARRLWLQALSGSSGRKLTPVELIASQWAQVWLAFNSTEPEQGLAPLSVLESLYAGSASGPARVNLWRARIALQMGDLAGARSFVEQAFARFRRQPNRAGLLACLQTALEVEQKQNTRAGRQWIRRFCLQARELREYDEMRLWSYLGLASLAANGDGDYRAARQLLEQAFQLFPSDVFRMVTLSIMIRLHEQAGGDPCERIHWLEQRWQLFGKMGPRQPVDHYYHESLRHVYLAQLAECYLRKDPHRSLALYQEARGTALSQSARLEILYSQLVKGSEASAIAVTHEGLQETLQLAESSEDAGKRLDILEGLVAIAASRTRLREMWDDNLLPRAESSLGILRAALLLRHNELLQLEMRFEARIMQSERLAQFEQASTFSRDLSLLLLVQERNQEALWALDRGLEQAFRAKGLNRQASLRELRARLCHSLGRSLEALEDLRLARDLCNQEGNRDALGSASYVQATRSLYLRKLGRIPEALENAREGLRSRGLAPQEQVSLGLQEALALVELRRYAEAHHSLERALDKCEDGLTRVVLLVTRAGVERYEGSQEVALETWRRAWDLSRELHSLTVREVCLSLGNELELLGRPQEASEVYVRTAEVVDLLAREYPPEARARIARHPSTRALAALLKKQGWQGWSWDVPDQAQPLSRATGDTASFLEDCSQARSLVSAWDARLPIAVGDFVKLKDNPQCLVEYILGSHEIHILAAGQGKLRFYRRRVEQARVRGWVAKVWSDGEGREARKELFRLLTQPFIKDFAPKRVGVLPTEDLWYLPWAALQDEQDRFLCQRMQLSVSSHEDVRAEEAPWTLQPGRWLLVCGAEDDLPESRKEVDFIHGLFPQASLLLGKQATREHLLEGCQQMSLLHLASHSTVFPGDLNRSGLELADGVLPLSQLYQLKLAPGALVVMSSCRSAVGEALPGKEVGSLAGAWRAAGAGQVIASLRPVEDEAARRFFELFYAKLRQGRSPALALSETQSQLSSEKPLTDWASFLLFGRAESAGDALP